MKLRLIYFDFPFWRAETSRLALHLGGVPFEDLRPTGPEFRALKASGALPYGQLPVLEVDGHVVAQTAAIARFCGKLGGFYPTSEVDAARVDEMIATVEQTTALLNPTMRLGDPARTQAAREALVEDALPRWLQMMEARLETFEGGDWAVGGAMTIADLAIWRMVGWFSEGKLDHIPTDLVDRFPRLLGIYRRVRADPRVEAWMRRYDR